MLLRAKEPNKGKWNGVGGKIEPHESPLESCQREVFEETGLQVKNLVFRGIIKFAGIEGIYLFVGSEFEGNVVQSSEGKLEWKSIDWILQSKDVVSNIPLFLEEVVNTESEPKVYECGYSANGELISFQKRPITLVKTVGYV